MSQEVCPTCKEASNIFCSNSFHLDVKSFDEARYRLKLSTYTKELTAKTTKPYDLMQEYKKAVIEDDYEKAKAITDALKPLNYDTSDTHKHIKRLENI